MIQGLISHFGNACSGGGFLFFPTWYKYLPGNVDANGLCSPKLTSLNDVWLIIAAILEILLRLAALMAVGFIIYGGFEYITSQAEPANVEKARKTIINALVGLIIAILATAIIGFLAGSVS